MKRLRIALLLTLIAVLLLTSGGLAMSSANYRLDWFVPATGGGRINVHSANYAASFTYGQTAIHGGLASDNYRAGLGFWAGMLESIELPLWIVNLPMLIKQ